MKDPNERSLERGPEMNGQPKPLHELSLVLDRNNSDDAMTFYDLRIDGKDTDLWMRVDEEKKIHIRTGDNRDVYFKPFLELDDLILLKTFNIKAFRKAK